LVDADDSGVTLATTTRRGSGLDTRASIERTAAEVFRRQGFDASTLEDVAMPLGITRAAVLHHYGSKVALLEAVIAPVVAQLDELLERVAARGPLTARQQRSFLTDFVDLTCDNRSVAAMVIRDITVDKHLPPALQIGQRAARFASIVMSNNQTDQAAVLRALAALGAITRPLSAADELVDLSTPESRKVLVDCAIAALRAGR
jgi:AcrR family transcriptional regulator